MIPLGVLGAAHVPAAGGAWAPTDLGANLKAWYDASDTATITSSGGAVSQWNDKSGGGYHLAEGTSGAQPTTGTVTRNSLNVLAFDGGDVVYLGSGFPAVAQPFAIAAVLRDIPGGSRWYASNSNAVQPIGVSGMYAGSVMSGPTYTANTWAYVTHIYNGASSVSRLNGTPGSTGNSGSNGLGSGLWLGARIASYYLTGNIAEFLVIAGAVSGADLTSLETYLSDKWGF